MKNETCDPKYIAKAWEKRCGTTVLSYNYRIGFEDAAEWLRQWVPFTEDGHPLACCEGPVWLGEDGTVHEITREWYKVNREARVWLRHGLFWVNARGHLWSSREAAEKHLAEQAQAEAKADPSPSDADGVSALLQRALNEHTATLSDLSDEYETLKRKNKRLRGLVNILCDSLADYRVGPRIVEAAVNAGVPLHRLEDELDRRENERR